MHTYKSCVYKVNITSHSRVVVAVIVCYLDLQLPMQSVSITTDIVSSGLYHGEVYNLM